MREQMTNLDNFVSDQRTVFEQRLIEYKCTGTISWDDKSWAYGEKGVAWLREGNNHGLRFAYFDKMKGIEAMDVEQSYVDFMRAVIILETFRKKSVPSGAALEKRLNVMRRWYYEMVQMTGQMHPMYLTVDIIHAAMKRHKENSTSAPNVSDYCDIAVRLTKLIRPLNLTLGSIECENKYPYRNATHNTEKRKIADMNGEDTDDEKLISIRAFMCIIEMIFLAKTDSEKIILNFMLLLIVTGFRFQETQSLKIDALKKREITDEDKLVHAKKHGLPEYNLGIKYLGAKKAGWRIHWLAPSSIALVESIFDAVKELTADNRQRLKQYRKSGFTDFLPNQIKELQGDLVEVSELEGYLFTGSGGARANSGFRRSMLTAFSAKKIEISPAKVDEISRVNKRFYFSKSQVNDFVELRYSKVKAFDEGFECTLVRKDNGKQHKFRYEDLLFLVPIGGFGIDVDLITLSNPVPIDSWPLRAWLGSEAGRKSFFEKFGMTEDDGGRIRMGTHVPRHNINTFLAIAGVTDHLQAMLMGRVDITQNKHYQHQAESQSYKSASLAVMALEKDLEEEKEITLSKDDQLSLFDSEGEPAKPVPPKPPTRVKEAEVSRRINALAKMVKNKASSGVDAVKKQGVIVVDPKLSMEDNLKVNMHTMGESRQEVSKYISNTMSSTFLPELKNAHDKLIAAKKEKQAKELIRRHAKLHSMEIGSCTRDVARWGCPFAMKCQSGEPCGYFTLTGRLDELEAVTARCLSKQHEVKELEVLCKADPSFELALKEQREALIVLEGFQQQAYTSLKDRRIVPLLSKDKDNPLAKIVERIEEQTLIGKTPKTLADMFFIEQKRIERAAKQEEAKSD
ncbi:hypothetical protein [Photobacterium leiognathi]|uniref:hypothetical protein n=1 Tax=Photobacterium leiognathi TaxID=553611 RepID=UPI002981CEE0|nr:hypothetical protein [Photobacterium leiognathi]